MDNPTVIIELLPPLLAGGPPTVQVHHEQCEGAWVEAVQLLMIGLDAAIKESYKALMQAQGPTIIPASQFPTGMH